MKHSCKSWFVACALALGLVACGDEPTTDINTMIDEGHATQALKALEPQLAENPTSPQLLALSLKANLMACAEADCPATAPLMLKTIAATAAQVKEPVALTETTTLNPATLFHEAALKLASLPTNPASLMALYNIAPEPFRPEIMDAAFTAPLIQLRNGKTAVAAGQLQALSNAETMARPLRTWALLGYGLATQQTGIAESAIIGLRNEAATTQLPPSAVRLIPHLLLVPAHNNPAQLSTLTPKLLTSWALPFAADPAFTNPAAAELNTMRANAGLLERLSGVRTMATLTSATTAFNANALTQLHLMRLSLALNPNQPDLWELFLPLASKAQQATPNLNLLGGEGAPTTPPADLQDAYIATLFRLMEVEAARNGDMMPLLSHITTLKLSKPTEVKLEKMVQEGLENAAANRQIPQLMAYASFKPDVARNTQQIIVPPLLEAIRTDLQTGNYDHAVTLASFLTDDLNIDVNFEALMMRELDTQLQVDGTLDGLSSDTPDMLLQPLESATLNLGKLWEFIVRYAADTPTLLDQHLKTMVASARGIYGTPTALYRLGAHFPPETFPPEARRTYLNQAIVQSLLQDDKLTGPQLADTAWRLARVHTGLTLAPVLEEALKRTATLEDSRTLWHNAPAAVRQTLATVRPTFASLMRGIDAWEAGRIGPAAEAFAELDSSYASKVEPYLLHLRDQLMQVNGLYATLTPTSGKTALVAVHATGLTGQGTLAGLQLTFTNQLGSSTSTNSKTLTTDHATLRTATVTVPLNFATFSTTVDASTKAATNMGFDDAFGPISKLAWQGDKLLVTGTNGTTTFRRVTADDTALAAPQGTYAVSQQLSKTNAATDVILPPGSLLTLATANQPTRVVTKAEDLGEVYPLTATLKHPGMLKPEDVKGYYNPTHHSFSLTFTPPLLKGGEAKAALRCQVVGPALLCGAHHTHSNRAQFVHHVLALQTRESAAQQAQALAEASARQTKLWQTLTAADMLHGNDAEAEPTPTEANTLHVDAATLTTSSTTDILPPPDFLVSKTTSVSSSGL